MPGGMPPPRYGKHGRLGKVQKLPHPQKHHLGNGYEPRPAHLGDTHPAHLGQYAHLGEAQGVYSRPATPGGASHSQGLNHGHNSFPAYSEHPNAPYLVEAEHANPWHGTNVLRPRPYRPSRSLLKQARRRIRVSKKGCKAFLDNLAKDLTPEKRQALKDEVLAILPDAIEYGGQWWHPSEHDAEVELDEEDEAAEKWLQLSPENQAISEKRRIEDEAWEERTKDLQAALGEHEGLRTRWIEREIDRRKEETKDHMLHESPDRWHSLVEKQKKLGQWKDVPALPPQQETSSSNVSRPPSYFPGVSGESNSTLGGTLLGGAAGSFLGRHFGSGPMGVVLGGVLGAFGGHVASKNSAKEDQTNKVYRSRLAEY